MIKPDPTRSPATTMRVTLPVPMKPQQRMEVEVGGNNNRNKKRRNQKK